MEKFRRQFLLDSVNKLKNLQSDLRNVERRDVFRTLHTIKGTSQTFNFTTSSRLAHELEDILSASQSIENTTFELLLIEGIGLLIESLEQKDFEFPVKFAEKIQQIIPEKDQTKIPIDFLSAIPPKILTSLATIEKFALDSALQSGKNIYCFEIGFELENFSEMLKNLREVLINSGEIIATLPSIKFKENDKIGFQILFASSAKRKEIEEIAETYAAELIMDTSPYVLQNYLQSILSKVVEHGKNLSSKLSKEIEFDVSADEIKLSSEKLNLVFTALLHLIRNAVDHAIDKKGRIEITAKADQNGLKITVADSGNGIDLEKIKATAIEKKIISADETLTEDAILALIFQSEFSTAKKITGISGRGIGLDVAKELVEKSGGKITVETQNGKGTKFEIFLPE